MDELENTGESLNPKKFSRSAKRLGDFGEGLVTYCLLRKGLEVACVDDVGADLIASGFGERFAISVKTRLFKRGSKESQMMVVESKHLEKLEAFGRRYGMIPLFAQIICLADDNIVHLFLLKQEDIKQVLPKVQNGYSLRFRSEIGLLTNHPKVDYSCWREQIALESWFGENLLRSSDANHNLIDSNDAEPEG
jgi:hypothetical protein